MGDIGRVEITKVVIKNKNYIITTSNNESYEFCEDDVVFFHLLQGKCFTAFEWGTILKRQKSSIAYQLAIHYIDFKPRSEKEVRTYLDKKGLENLDINIIIERLKAIHYIDDDRLSKLLVEQYSRNNLGVKKIEHKLKTIGLDSYSGKYLLLIQQSDQLKSAEIVGNKYLKTKTDIPLKKQKICVMDKLLREGFCSFVIEQILPILNYNETSIELLFSRIEKYVHKGYEGRKLIEKLLADGFEYSDIMNNVSILDK